jgi:dihydropteroate synthase
MRAPDRGRTEPGRSAADGTGAPPRKSLPPVPRAPVERVRIGSVLRFGTRVPPQDRALVMAIVNRTPDSFYDRGAAFRDDAALARVETAIAEGADIIDIGGVKAGPGAVVDVAEEVRRVVPFVAAVRDRHPDVVISVDTWRGEVGRLAVAEGADLLNDTWAGHDPTLGEVAADTGVGIVCSHTGGSVPRLRPHRVRYADVVADVVTEVTRQAEQLVARGVPREGILVDPTHDFGKNTFHGLALLRRCDELVATGWPVLMALSNKDFVGEALGVGLHERLEGTLAATALAAAAGARVFRAHEVAATRRTVDMVAAITGARPPARTVRALA